MKSEFSDILSYYHQSNPLWVQSQVGVAKPTTHDLPPLTHAYGKPNHKSIYDAGKLTNSWQVHTNSEKEKASYDYMKFNKLSSNRKLSPNEM